jgi:hypothetical protein
MDFVMILFIVVELGAISIIYKRRKSEGERKNLSRIHFETTSASLASRADTQVRIYPEP